MRGRKRTLLAAILLALTTSAHAATFEWGNDFETGTPTKQAGPGTYSGGVSATLPPLFRAQGSSLTTPDPSLYPNTTVSMPGIGNRAFLDFDSSAAGGASYGIAVLGANGHRTANTTVAAILGPPPRCFGGGTLNGRICSFDPQQNAGCGTTGVCRDTRIPLVTHATSSATGCTVFLSQACGSVDSVGRTCSSPSLRLRGLYGGPYMTPGAGVCGASRSMTDTPCGGPCSSTSDCLQGRPDAVAGDPTKSEPTACVSDRDPTVACDGVKRCAAGTNVGASCTTGSQCPGSTCQSACYCVNECDEVRKNEATCAPRTFLSVNVTRGEPYALGVEQNNQTDPGLVECRSYGGKFGKLCAGGSNDGAQCTTASECPSGTCLGTTAGVEDDVSMAFGRGGMKQKVGICTGGSALAAGGRNGTACATNADCGCGCYGGANAGAACTVDSQCPGGSCPGGCTPGTCTTTARITPDRVQWGWNDGTDPKARVALDASMTQIGDSPTVNVRTETLTVDGETGLTTGWLASGCSGADYTCFVDSDEPNGNTSVVYNQQSINLVQEWTFANPAATTLAPIGVAMNVAAQDNQPAANDGAGLQLQVWDAGGSTPSSPTIFDLANFDFDDGSSGGYYPVAPVIVTNELGTLTSSEIDGWRGRVTKADAGHGISDEARITFADLEVFWASPSPDPPNVLPGGKVAGVCCDSTSNASALYQSLSGLVVEPVALYDQADGGQSMGDIIAAAPTLFAGGSTSRSHTTPIYGTGGQHVDVMVVLATANTFNGLGTADPGNPAAFDGLGQEGHCESWISGSGYTANQGQRCHCDEASNWTSPSGDFVTYCLMKNASFGLLSSEAFCLCGANADCSLGGASPSGASATTTTCSSGFCTNTSASQRITAAAGTRAMFAPGCKSSTCPNGVCVQMNTIARALRGKRELEALAAAAGTKLIWATQPIPNGENFENERPAVEGWNATLLAEQKAIGGPWIDWAQYFFDQCGPSILVKKASNPCTTGVHYTPQGNEYYAQIINACWSNTTLSGVANKSTDGVCTTGPVCSGVCGSGLRKGIACGTNADCNYCADGAIGKLGRKCDANADCGYYDCGVTP